MSMDQVIFLLGLIVICGAAFYGLSIYFLSRRNRCVMKQILRMLDEEGDDDGEKAS